ncbi:XrtA/PEP-CTERM system amidotransferase [Roseiterribacter gracilis]|uniref:asparagine synthase (glutamine-hydrolyzing) n=1 Tax=Roseiterribacter gracilis TaxID=2812848 RepID=A0A8S8X8C9_9PROT|nr:amidotransferase 1, exosortase A system-associated [Rhodospirillales bacterium TMPK1]
MCGLAGLFDLEHRRPIDETILHAMTRAIAHRGPDGEGFHLAPGVGLGHRRLAIIDPAGGHQPMFNEDGRIAIVFNGEIYGFRTLVTQLEARGHVFKTRCDTEVVIHAWEEWGPACVERLDGMFALALWDEAKQTLFLARDRLGKKPLYYAQLRTGELIFGSEMKALLQHPACPRVLDPTAIDDFLAFGYVPDPKSIYEGIEKLPAATTLTIQRGRKLPSPVTYWKPSFKSKPINEDAAVISLAEKLERAVEARRISDVPLGAFLSGGVDSSGVVALLAKRQGADPVKTFAIGFETGVDELPYARTMAERYGTDHTEERQTLSYLDAIDRQAAIFDEPFADSSSVPTLRVSELARRRVTVALSGDGGDELFAGYRRYRLFQTLDRVRTHVPQSMRTALLGPLGRAYPKLDNAPRWLRAKHTLLELASDSSHGWYRTVCKMSDELRCSLMSPALRASLDGYDPADTISQHWNEADASTALGRAQYVDLKTWLIGDILAKVDRASMAASLEVRVPMLDYHFVEWAASLPDELKIQNGQQKHILKRALEPLVPHENLYRPKTGFATDLADQMRREMPRLRQRLCSDAMQDSGLLDMQAVRSLLDRHESGKRDHAAPLWSLAMLEGFLRVVHGSAVQSPPKRAVERAA